ncbi:hypothetical protein, partial [Pantoea endophytica]
MSQQKFNKTRFDAAL